MRDKIVVVVDRSHGKKNVDLYYQSDRYPQPWRSMISAHIDRVRAYANEVGGAPQSLWIIVPANDDPPEHHDYYFELDQMRLHQ